MVIRDVSCQLSMKQLWQVFFSLCVVRLLCNLENVLGIGEGRFRVKLNGFSFGPTIPTTLDVFQPGNLICVGQPGAGAGIEIRYNHGVR